MSVRFHDADRNAARNLLQLRRNAASAIGAAAQVRFVPQCVNSWFQICCILHEWPHSPLRCSSDFAAAQQVFALRALAAKIRHFRNGLTADLGCGAASTKSRPRSSSRPAQSRRSTAAHFNCQTSLSGRWPMAQSACEVPGYCAVSCSAYAAVMYPDF